MPQPTPDPRSGRPHPTLAWLTALHPRITEADRPAARLLTILMLIHIPFILSALGVMDLVWRQMFGQGIWATKDVQVILAGTAVVVLGYGLLRAGRFRLGAAVFILSMAAIALLAPFVDDPTAEIGILALMVIPVLLTAIFFSEKIVLAALASFAALAVLQLQVTPIAPRLGATGYALILAVLLAGALIVVFRRHIAAEERAQHERLRASEERFRRMIEHSLDIIVLLDAEGRITFVSEAAERLMGFAPAELVGRISFDLLHPEDRAPTLAALQASLASPGEPRSVEFRFAAKGGGWVPLEAVGVNRIDDPVVRALVLNVRDVRERQRAAEERRRLEAQLLQAMKMEAIGRLAGGVAHDFNNLLTGISGNIALALLDLDKDGAVAGLLREADRGAQSAASLTKQLLAFSRKQLLEPRLVDLNALIANLQRMLARLIGEDITLTTTPDARIGAVRIDPGQFEQILVNLAINARDAMPQGGRLLIETAAVDLDDAYAQIHPGTAPGRYVMLAVSDTGHGMSAEVKQHLFEPFYTTKPHGHGTGLGLATTFGAVKQASGSIEVYSEVGHGTTFKIYLPRAAEQAEPLPPSPRRDDLPGGRETVLLVEDERQVRELALKLLRRLGYDVLVAETGEEALVLASAHPGAIHLLITDVVMPGMNGRELARRLAALHPEAKVLYTSGYTENIIAHHGVLDAGIRFIGKPYTPQSMAHKIREALEAE
jgi:two-component system, cell cycle sensor histidine kinase and response regulator CckA